MSKKYFEIVYNGPFKGVNTALPEDVIEKPYSPLLSNFILKNGEIRSRVIQNNILPSTPDNYAINLLTSFQDANNVIHTVAVTSFGLWQLNRTWNKNPTTSNRTWQLVAQDKYQLSPNIPVATATFLNKLFWTHGDNNLWMWDGISSQNAPRTFQPNIGYLLGDTITDSNGNQEVVTVSGYSGSVAPTWPTTLGGTVVSGAVTFMNNGKPIVSSGPINSIANVVTSANILAGAYYLIELNSQLIMLNTVEGVGNSLQNFPQRIRWSPSGLPTIWDPVINIGAGYVDELDVPDVITGAFTAGTTGFILRTNGITEMTSNAGSGQNPWNFNHLWASDRGIGNVFSFGYASYGPLGIFIASDDIYNVSLGGFKKIGGVARDSIYNDLAKASSPPIGTIVPFYSSNYIYNHYRLMINQGNNAVTWIYSIEDDSWQKEFKSNINFTGIARYCYTS